ncbi:MAG: hypothetical protein M3229_03505 [Actinomycetota bacterium]|nr:hypothetical protein [Actinomycetota bacterium]
MAERDSIRIEIAFEGGQIMAAMVSPNSADALERALADGSDGTFALDASEGRYSVVLRHVVYVKRFARESRVGFGI